MDESIVVRGARANNLKGFSIEIPRDKLVVITGPSGSGKSTLAFDTIYAEGQRRYVESMSTYARQFLDQMAKPEVDSIDGLSPTIAIEQRTTTYNPRSTVGTVTEVYDYLRLLFARIAHPQCYQCGKPIRSQSQSQIVDFILSMDDSSKLWLMAPIAQEKKGEFVKELADLRQRGFVRARIDGNMVDLADEESMPSLDRNQKHTIEVVVDRFVLRGDKGALRSRLAESVELALRLGSGQLLVRAEGGKSAASNQDVLFSEKFACSDCRISYPEPEPRLFSFNSPVGACKTCEGLGSAETGGVCPSCEGRRLGKEALSFKHHDHSIHDYCFLTLEDLQAEFGKQSWSKRDEAIAGRLRKEIVDRLSFLVRVGVGYLQLARSAQTLSGGESQRIRLATQIGSSLVGVIYVLDEPSIGLHPFDHDRLLESLCALRDQGNTVLVVEHDQDTMERADWIVDMGPGAGRLGGSVTAEGTPSAIKKNRKSLTGLYLSGGKKIAVPQKRRTPKAWLTLTGVTKHNLNNVSAKIPLGVLSCVTGVSGSGKSTLIRDVLFHEMSRSLLDRTFKSAIISSGLENLDKIIEIDQEPIGKTPRSNPATYTGVFTLIRDLFARLPEAQVRGYTPGRFSFNAAAGAGRCQTCEGDGMTRVEMHFLPDVFVKCLTCEGKRYNLATLDVLFNGKSIADVLAMTGEEARDFFKNIHTIHNPLSVLCDVGLGYLHLGQSATTLSGGEAQRIKLAKELSRRATGKTLYIMDEPTTGLHFDDIKKLIGVTQSLVDHGNTVVVIEHQLDVIKSADWVIDLGPGGGKKGGTIVANGTPEETAKTAASVTGRYLKNLL